MCLDKRALRSLAAHKGWVTRRRRAEEQRLSETGGAGHLVLDPPIKGGVRSPSLLALVEAASI